MGKIKAEEAKLSMHGTCNFITHNRLSNFQWLLTECTRLLSDDARISVYLVLICVIVIYIILANLHYEVVYFTLIYRFSYISLTLC